MRTRLDYICMQPTREGQASHAHVNEIVAGLRRRGWHLQLVEPAHPKPGRADGPRRLLAAAAAQLRYWAGRRFRTAPFVYIRAHFLALPTACLARLAGSIVVQEINGPATDAYDAWPVLRPLHGVMTRVMRLQVRWASAVVVVTDGLEAYIREQTGRQTGYYVIGNGADTERFRPVAATGPVDRRPYAVFVGALASWQGVDTILDAVASPTWPPGLDLVVAGDGRERQRVEAAARANPSIVPLGTVPYADTPALVAGSVAALVPMVDAPRSSHGLSPLKLFEGMACGVPVVASDLPDLGDVVRRHGCGVTFAAGDGEALASAVAGIVADPDLARSMGARGREAAVAHYSWDVRAGQTDAMLRQLELERRAGRSRRRR